MAPFIATPVPHPESSGDFRNSGVQWALSVPISPSVQAGVPVALPLRIGGLCAALLVLTSAVSAADKGKEADPVPAAIARGVAALKASGGVEPPGQSNPAGLKALVALTLLACDVPADDPKVAKLVGEVRKAAPELAHTYSMALVILLFDRLGEPADVPLVQALGVRLLAGQNGQGGWTYKCPRPAYDEVRRLSALVAKPIEQPRPKDDKQPREAPPLAKELQEQLKALASQPAENVDPGAGDNSNTQFAVLGLWVARRYGVPVEKALGRADGRFRSGQNNDGGWGYVPLAAGEKANPSSVSTASMTCAGLMSLAIRHGVAQEEARRTGKRVALELIKDDAIRNGFAGLGTAVGQPSRQGIASRGSGIRKGYYFLWSLERVAVAHGLKTVGGKDWFAWGSELLLNSQQSDGTWSGEWGADVDTCFALLFLRRANLAEDLTGVLRGQVEGLGEVTLKAGLPENSSGKKIDSGLAPAEGPAGESEAARLRDELLRTSAERQVEVIDRYKDTKGVVYTEALATAIPRLTGTARGKARDALAERLTRMTPATLRGKLTEEDAEVRRAAALACGMKDDKEYVPDLLRLLDDAEPGVVRAAAVALQSLTGEKFGPAADATATERAAAIRAWKAWWDKKK
jgi:hypothetical protein